MKTANIRCFIKTVETEMHFYISKLNAWIQYHALQVKQPRSFFLQIVMSLSKPAVTNKYKFIRAKNIRNISSFIGNVLEKNKVASPPPKKKKK